jgi:hypothetical protein
MYIILVYCNNVPDIHIMFLCKYLDSPAQDRGLVEELGQFLLPGLRATQADFLKELGYLGKYRR